MCRQRRGDDRHYETEFEVYLFDDDRKLFVAFGGLAMSGWLLRTLRGGW